MAHVAVLGTGLLGSGFVENLLAKGIDVVVWNRSPDKTLALVQKGARVAANPAMALDGASRAHLVLTADDAVDAVLAAAEPGWNPATPVIDHSTSLPERVSARYAHWREGGRRYVPAPVFMAPANARTASGLMLLACPAAEEADLRPTLETMTGKVWYTGERPDLPAVLKLCGNGALLSLAGMMGDLFQIARSQDVPESKILELFDVFQLGGGLQRAGERVRAAGSAPPSFELTMARKDLGLMLEAAGTNAHLAVLPGVAAAMDRAIDHGHGAQDFAIFARP
jgi:3-hydroxyisobutyrate dehydrogenase-like beta-hydroxyacid dehydrogenase